MPELIKKTFGYFYIVFYNLKCKIKGGFQILWWNKNRNIQILLATCLFVFSIIELIHHINSKSINELSSFDVLKLFLSVFSFVLLVYLLVKSIASEIQFNFSSSDKKFGHLHDELSIDNSSNTQINIFKPKNQAIIFSKEVNSKLEFSSNNLFILKESYELPFIVKHFSKFLIKELRKTNVWKSTTTNDDKVKLCNDISLDILNHKKDISIQKTNYFKDRLSNTLANYQIDHNNDEFINLRKEFVLRDGKLISLTDSKLSNQLGGSSILVCKEGIVLLTQNNTNENPDSLSPSGSGSFDFKNPHDFKTFQKFAKYEAARELIEECGLLREDLEIQLCGYGRYIYRNGKPEIFCIASTTKSWNELKPSLHERLYQKKSIKTIEIEGEINRVNTIKLLEKLTVDCEEQREPCKNANGPLYWNLLFALEYLKHNINLEKEKKLFFSNSTFSS